MCITGEGGQTYCSEYCEAGSCPDGFPCQRYPFDGADLREICAPRCDRDEQCLSMACDEATGRCLFPGDGTQGPGEPCGGDAGLCRYGNLCVTQEAGRRCMATCNPDADPFCADGAFCFPALAPGGGLCWLGGTAGPGAPCLSHRDCPLGYLCLEARVGEPSCRKGCDPRDGEPGCPAGTECLTVPEKVYGFCR
ncbi:MAG: hypothetical protein D6729_14400 [Deltaproteobacteria bacterium]|nr:MAG: hypothetical protein D6729_14400 [Deltaproteobacteria bacterium]